MHFDLSREPRENFILHYWIKHNPQPIILQLSNDTQFSRFKRSQSQRKIVQKEAKIRELSHIKLQPSVQSLSELLSMM